MRKIYFILALILGSIVSEAQIFKKKQKETPAVEKEEASSKEASPEDDVLDKPKSDKKEKPKKKEKKTKEEKPKKSKEAKNKKEEKPKKESKVKAEKVDKPSATKAEASAPIQEKDEADLSQRSLLEFGFRAGGNYLQSKMPTFSTPQLTSSGLPVVLNGKVQRDAFSLSSEPQFGGTVATFFRISKGYFFFQPEISASLKGGMIQNSNTMVNSMPIDARYISVDFAPTVGLRSKNLRIFTGPIASYPIQYQTKLIDALKVYSLTELPKSAFESYGLNYQIGAGYDIGLWELDVRYEFGLKPISKIALGTVNLPSEFNYTSGMFQFSIGRILWNKVK